MNNVVIYSLLNLILAPITILFLRKFKFHKTKEVPKEVEANRNDKYYNHLFSTMNTPSSFGILFILNVTIYFILNYSNLTLALGLMLVGSLVLGLLGLSDDIYQFFLYVKDKQWGFKARYKATIQLIVIFIILYFTLNSLWLSLIAAFFAVFVLNSFNITDGLDGLAGGLLLQVIPIFLFLEYKLYGPSAYTEVLTIITIFLVVFLVFNIKPAKVWLGDSGSYILGTLLAVFMLRYPLVYSIPLISIFLLEGSSSLIQILSLKVFKRRVFAIAPLHLHLLNNGWSQWRAILTAWIIQFVISISILGIIVYVR